MSRPLVYLVAVSRHPLLMDDPTARDVLVCMADSAQDRNGGRIVGSLASFAAACQRGYSAVRHARDRLIEAGLLIHGGGGDTSKRAESFYIDEDVLNGISKRITQGQTQRDRKESVATLLPRTCREPAVNLPPDRRELAVDLPQDCREPAVDLPPTRARALNRNVEHEQGTENRKNKPEGVTPSEAPWTLPAHPVGDALLAKHNAAAVAQRAALAARSQPALLETAPTAEPATAEATAAEARVQAAIEALLPDLREYHHAKAGSTASARIIAGWRTKLATRLADDGVTAERIDARVLGIRAVLRWWRLPIEATAQPGEPFCFYQPDLRSIAKLLDTANHLDKLIGWAADPRRKPGSTGWGNAPTVKRTRGGVELGAPRYELETNDDGTLRW